MHPLENVLQGLVEVVTGEIFLQTREDIRCSPISHYPRCLLCGHDPDLSILIWGWPTPGWARRICSFPISVLLPKLTITFLGRWWPVACETRTQTGLGGKKHVRMTYHRVCMLTPFFCAWGGEGGLIFSLSFSVLPSPHD